MNSNEDYQNLVGLLEQALRFYANADNYKINRKTSDHIFSLIEMDSGTQARFALKLVEDNSKLMDNLNEEYLKDFTENTDDDKIKQQSNESLIDGINALKNLLENEDKI